jgi:hypothetical protein
MAMPNMAFERDAPKTARPSTLRYVNKERKSIMIPEFTAAVQSVKVLKDILTAAHELKDSTALIAAVNDVHGKLVIAYENVINSQEKRLAAQQRITELEQEIAAIMNWKQEAERYSLTEIGTGVFAFVVKPES